MAKGPLEPGDRDRTVTIQQRATTDATADSGFPVETWTTLVASMPASREEISGWERMQSGGLNAGYDTRWQTNYRLDLDPELLDVPKLRRLIYRGRPHDIVSGSVIGLREGIELLTIASTRVD